MKLRIAWPIDIPTTLSIIAIVLSLLQLLLNTPILIEFYRTPQLVVTGSGSRPDDEELMGMFLVRNEGRASANNVQIGLLVQEHQRISLMPNINARITDDKNPHVRNVRIEIPKILPKEEIVVLVVPGPNLEHLIQERAKLYLDLGIREIPMVSFIKSDEGQGRNLTAAIDQKFLKQTNSTSHSSGSAEAGR